MNVNFSVYAYVFTCICCFTVEAYVIDSRRFLIYRVSQEDQYILLSRVEATMGNNKLPLKSVLPDFLIIYKVVNFQ